MVVLTKKQKVQEEEYALPYHYFDLRLEEFKYIRCVEYLSYLNAIRRLMGDITGKKILDAGCGDGRLCYELRNSNAKIFGVDYSERAIAFAKIFNPNAVFFNESLDSFNTNEKFDFIVLLETLEHIIPAETNKVLKNLKNLMKKNGRLIITVPSKNIKLAEKHYRHFSEKDLRETLRGFKAIKITGHGRMGIKRKIFTLLQKFSILIFPFRNKIPCIRSIFNLAKSFYTRHLENCAPEDAMRLIAVCEPN